jgi:hypothetical protein
MNVADDKGMEMMEPLLNGSFVSHDSAKSEKSVTLATNNAVESKGSFGIGPIKLAKLADIDGSHEAPGERGRLLSAKLFLEIGGYEGLAELIKTDL